MRFFYEEISKILVGAWRWTDRNELSNNSVEQKQIDYNFADDRGPYAASRNATQVDIHLRLVLPFTSKRLETKKKNNGIFDSSCATHSHLRLRIAVLATNYEKKKKNIPIKKKNVYAQVLYS